LRKNAYVSCMPNDLKYATLDGRGMLLSWLEAYVLDGNRWREASPAERADAEHRASIISEQEFKQRFPKAPPLPVSGRH
jgi:hypothetical protein